MRRLPEEEKKGLRTETVEVGSTGRRIGWGLAIVAILALHLSLFWMGQHPEPRRLTGDELRYVDEGRRLARGQAVPLDALWPVLYSRFLALIFAAGGDLLAVQVAQTLLLLSVAVMLQALTSRLTGSSQAARLAAALALAYPPLVAFCHFFWPEILHLALFLGAILILVEHPRRPAWLATAGVSLGLALLTKKLLWPFVPLLLLPLIFGSPQVPSPGELSTLRPQRLQWKPALWVMAGILVILSPAMVIWGPYAISPTSSAIFNLWVGLGDVGVRSFEEPVVFERYQDYSEVSDEPEERDRATVGEIVGVLGEGNAISFVTQQASRQYRRLFHRDSFLTDQLPGGKLAERGKGYFSPRPALATSIEVASKGMYTTILALAAFGLTLLGTGLDQASPSRANPSRAPGRVDGAADDSGLGVGDRQIANDDARGISRSPQAGHWLAVLLLFLLYNVALFFWVHVKSRYRIQFLPVLFLYAGWMLALWFPGSAARLPTRRWAPQELEHTLCQAGIWRCLAGVALASLWLTLAWLG